VRVPPRLRLLALVGLPLALLAYVSLPRPSPGRPPEAGGCAGPTPAPGNAEIEDRVVELVNERRAAVGLPPLKRIEELTGSSRWFAQSMATQDYFPEDHHSYVRSGDDLRRACDWSTRVGWFYAGWHAIAETIAAGHETPEEVVRGWMESPGHRAKILGRSYWETGAGYWAGGSEGHYWVEDFGRRRGFFPVVIDGEARRTPKRDVRLYVYGSWREMRLRNDDGLFGPWRPFTSDLDWSLADGTGLRTVTVEMRDGRTRATSSDTILLSPPPPT